MKNTKQVNFNQVHCKDFHRFYSIILPECLYAFELNVYETPATQELVLLMSYSLKKENPYRKPK